MKYRVHVKEVWIQSYTVEANSKAHAKNLVEQARQRPMPQVQKDARPVQPWGVLGSESWDVEPFNR